MRVECNNVKSMDDFVEDDEDKICDNNKNGYRISIKDGGNIDFRIKNMITKETLRNHWCNNQTIQMSISKIIE